LILLGQTVNASSEIISSQASSLGISSFIKKSSEYTKEAFPDLDLNELFENSIQGKLNISGLFGMIVDLLGVELKSGISSMIAILIVIVIHSILKAVIENLGNESVARIAYFVQYLIIVSLVVSNFTDLILVVKNAISEIINFMMLLIPILTALMLTTGAIVSTTVTESVLLVLINVIGRIIGNLIIPLLLAGTSLAIVNSVSDKVQVSRLAKFINSLAVWILGVVLTVFVAVLLIEGTLSTSVDGLTAKTAKTAISTFIPVVGKIMGDTVDTVIGCANLLKNAVGIIGVLILFGIVAIPIIKVAIMWALIRLLASLCEVIADEKIVRLFDIMSESYKVLFGILISVSIMFIVGVTLVLRMTNIVS
jgi:stage III sporulation protein AE